MEQCKNLWNYNCTCKNIQPYLQIKGKNWPICQQCWNQITEQEKDRENKNASPTQQ
jgi:hypothetical protein